MARRKRHGHRKRRPPEGLAEVLRLFNVGERANELVSGLGERRFDGFVRRRVVHRHGPRRRPFQRHRNAIASVLPFRAVPSATLGPAESHTEDPPPWRDTATGASKPPAHQSQGP